MIAEGKPTMIVTMNELLAEDAIAAAHRRALAADHFRREAEEFARTSVADLRRIMLEGEGYREVTEKIRRSVIAHREGLYINTQEAEDSWARMAYRNRELICEAEIQVLANTFAAIIEENYNAMTMEVAQIAAEAIRNYDWND